ncbi:ribonuclease P protein component [Brachybacterium endophyticum]|uniref:Ribonuclease P protein component n=1 Tax=Brachybacterium endophyticum TaxID=2182385 RepID=A0A2U2RJJ3_9MICO|nr:ribonuclease P protein component [Brachybacterium endophyticum]PWH05954.1 ribonuclease P protein component [Brachybacterium endophyticum]
MNWSRHRLHTAQQFRTASRRGVRAARSHVVAHLVLRTEGPQEARVGFVVSTKVGNSVIRHRVTRRLREITRAHLAEIPESSDLVLRTLPGIQDVPFAELEEQVVGALSSARRKLERRGARSSSEGSSAAASAPAPGPRA